MIHPRALLGAAVALLAPSLLAAQAVTAPTLPRMRAPQPTAPAISAADLMTRIYLFADDSMHTREAGTIGNVKGTDYIAREAQRIGLRPAGENGTFFQTVPIVTLSLDTGSTLQVDGSTLEFRTDWGPIQGTRFANGSLPVIYAGIFGAPPTITP